MKKEQKIVLIVLAVIALAVAWFYILYAYMPANVKITSIKIYPTSASKGQTVSVEMKLKNNLPIPQRVYFEAGIIPNIQYSFIPLGITFGGKCCPQNENYDGRYILLAPYEEATVVVKPKMPTETSYDHCHNLGSYWKGTGTYYVELAVTTTCWGESGYKLLDYQVRTINMI